MGAIDLHDNVKMVRAYSPQAATTDTTPIVTQIVDRADFATLEFGIAIGAAGTGCTAAVSLEEGNDSALADTAVPATSVLLGTLAAAGFTTANGANATRKIGYIGSKRYVRLTITPAGNSGSLYVSILGILSGAP